MHPEEEVVENHLIKKTRGRYWSGEPSHQKSQGKCSGEPSHQKNQGKVQWRTIPPKEPGECAVENHPTKRTRGRCSAETFN